MQFKIIIAGTRTFSDYGLLRKTVLQFVKEKHMPKASVTIVSGKTRGADMLGERFAQEFGLEVAEFPADWDKYGKSAGYRRNEEMACYAAQPCGKGFLIAFWDGKSHGTKHMVDIARLRGIETKVVRYKGWYERFKSV